MSDAKRFYNHIRKQLVYVPNTSIAERLKKHILAHPNFNSSRSFLDLVVANYCTNRKRNELPSVVVISWLSKFLDVSYENSELLEVEE
nr:MAG TPA: hypothetical protein [Caudoviricetes sp.]